jgi:hypothetical protein
MDAVFRAQPCVMPADRIASLVRAFEDAEPLAAILEHLRHERETVEAAIHVECRKDLVLAPDLYPVVHA